MSHLESLIAEYLEWQGYLIRRNMKVGRRAKGGWEMELDVVGYHPQLNKIIHYEPSIDALRWADREARYVKKFRLAQRYMFTEVFSWLDSSTQVEQIAVFYDHPKGARHDCRREDYVDRRTRCRDSSKGDLMRSNDLQCDSATVPFATNAPDVSCWL